MTHPFAVHPVRLTALSPIHIGSGVDLDWTQAVLDGSRMETFDPMLADLPDAARSKLLAAASSSNAADAIIALQKLFKEQRRPLLAARTGSIGLTGAVQDKFEKSFGRNTQARQGGEAVVNELQLARHALDAATGLPYVPGTSLKGALRTAVIAQLHDQRHPARASEANPDFKDPSDELLGRFHASPFSRVMLSDLRPVGNAMGIAAVVQANRRRFKGDRNDWGVPVTVELLPAFFAGAYVGEIRIGAERGPKDPVKTLPDLVNLMRIAHQYHASLFDFFAERLAQEERGLMVDWLRSLRELLASPDMAAAFAEGRAALVRLGKYCSAESKTVVWRSIRNSKAKRGEPDRMLNATTLWLADFGAAGRLPLGWAVLEVGEHASEAVAGFCARFRGEAEVPAATEDGSAAATATIIPDRSTPNLQRLAMLEDEHDRGKPNDPLLDATIRQSKAWPEADRLLLARLVEEKLRAPSKLGWKWRDLDKLLLPWTPQP